MKKNYDSFGEMEDLVWGFCTDDVVFCNYEEDDLVETYISNIFTFYLQERITQDILANGFDEELIDLLGEVFVSIPEGLIDYYRDAVDLDEFDVPEGKKVNLTKMNKHALYKIMIENQRLFEDQDNGLSFHSRSEIENLINGHLKNRAKANNQPSLKIDLSASTLTAMVRDGVLEREFSAEERCYTYRLILPIKEQYKR